MCFLSVNFICNRVVFVFDGFGVKKSNATITFIFSCKLDMVINGVVMNVKQHLKTARIGSQQLFFSSIKEVTTSGEASGHASHAQHD